MARIILPKHGELPQNEGERRVLAFLDGGLPPQPPQNGWTQFKEFGPEYILIPNLEIPDNASRFLEIDCIAVTPHAVYVIEVKDWGGSINGDDTTWYLNDGRERKNPHKGLNYKCRVLKSMLERANASLRHTWVQGIVVIAREDSQLGLRGQCKSLTFVLNRNLSEYLKDPARIKAPRRILPQELISEQERIAMALTGRGRPRKDEPLVIMGYKVEEVLAQEEYLTEYLARSTRGSFTSKQQRLKVFRLPVTLADSERRALKNRMLRNYDALEAIGSHPNLVSLKGQYDLESEQVVEILDWSEEGTLRKTLDERSKSGSGFTWQESLDLVRGLAAGLSAAHEQGIIHRNLRPENILMTPYGPQLMNFDLAYLPGSTTQTVWKPVEENSDQRYLPPELTLGLDAYEVYNSSDLYSLGVIWYELLCGKVPFESPLALETLGGVLPDEYLPSKFNTDCPAWIDEVMKNLYATQLDWRFGSVSELLMVLEEHLNEPSTAENMTGSSLDEDPNRQLQPGEQILEYTVIRHLGGGGFAQVYQVRHTLKNKDYALKILNQSVPLNHLVEEYNLLDQINHPNIVKVYWPGQLPGGRYYITMEYLSGDSLSAYAWGPKRLPWESILNVAEDMLSALRYLHEGEQKTGELEGKILYHRDIKPLNILHEPGRGYVLIDFNVAKESTGTDTWVGSDAYIAPDLVDGRQLHWDASGDTFALGVTLYELACKQHPYPQKRPQITAKPIHPSETKAAQSIPRVWQEFLLRAVQSRKELRFATALEMEAEFLALLNDASSESDGSRSADTLEELEAEDTLLDDEAQTDGGGQKSKSQQAALERIALACEIFETHGLEKRELASGVSFFSGNQRVAKVTKGGRLEINLPLSADAVGELEALGFQNWSVAPRNGVRYYGLVSQRSLEILCEAWQPNKSNPVALQEINQTVGQDNLVQPIKTQESQQGGMLMRVDQIKVGMILGGADFPEPVKVVALVPTGAVCQIFAQGLETNTFFQPMMPGNKEVLVLSVPGNEQFDGNATRFRLGIEALRLGLAYEYDPFLTLSIARVDPLPHQLEAVYDYFLKLPRIRFLLADDPGAGKTIMAGLLIKELKIRGLIKRILIITPANLTFQWQRELKDKFREEFEVIRGDVLRVNYGSNPWQEKNQVITSVSWVSNIEDARLSLLRSEWDLIIVDEAHKLSYQNQKTNPYKLGEELFQRTDHLLLMTATPHKGDTRHFQRFLELLDRDVYGDIKSLDAALNNNQAPFYLRRIKEALVTFPDPETGLPQRLFTKRNVITSEFSLSDAEMRLYYALTEYVEEQSRQASGSNTPQSRAIGFTMAMLQRRFASSVYALRRTLERMVERRQEILKDPEGYRRAQILKRIPDEFDELTDEEQQNIMDDLENTVISYDPVELKKEIRSLSELIEQARELESQEIETKLVALKKVLTDYGVFADPKMKLLLFTEHKDTLDYLSKKLTEWGLVYTQIHGGMKIGDRDTPGTRIYAEQEFRTSCQVLLATEAAGEGINLQFCWMMVNYDIPWVPIRLEQRMGRIHRYGQEKDCLIFNFVATNTREGRVLAKLFERVEQIEADLDPNKTGKVFNVLGELFPSNELEKLIRDMYAHNQTEDSIKNRIVERVDADKLQHITRSTLEGLAKKELNLSAIVGRTTEARERRLVPEVIEQFFVDAGPLAGIYPKKQAHEKIWRIGRIPRTLRPLSDKLEGRFGKLGREYGQVIFDKELLKQDATLEWVTPGHALFETVREYVLHQTQPDIKHGALFYDINIDKPLRMDVFSAAIGDGRGKTLHRRIFVLETNLERLVTLRQPTLFLDLIPSEDLSLKSMDSKGFQVINAGGQSVAHLPPTEVLPSVQQLQAFLYEDALEAFLQDVQQERMREIETIEKHLVISLDELILRQNLKIAELLEQQASGDESSLLQANLKQYTDRYDELNLRKEQRLSELQRERQCSVSDVQHIGRAWVLPHPERNTPRVAPMVRDDEIEQIAVNTVTQALQAEGWSVQSVESENRGFDLIARWDMPRELEGAEAYPPAAIRFIEVKGRSQVGTVGLTRNEYQTAQRLKGDYWLYVVYNCATQPEVHAIQDPAKLDWEPVRIIEHYQIGSKDVVGAET